MLDRRSTGAKTGLQKKCIVDPAAEIEPVENIEPPENEEASLRHSKRPDTPRPAGMKRVSFSRATGSSTFGNLAAVLENAALQQASPEAERLHVLADAVNHADGYAHLLPVQMDEERMKYALDMHENSRTFPASGNDLRVICYNVVREISRKMGHATSWSHCGWSLLFNKMPKGIAEIYAELDSKKSEAEKLYAISLVLERCNARKCSAIFLRQDRTQALYNELSMLFKRHRLAGRLKQYFAPRERERYLDAAPSPFSPFQR